MELEALLARADIWRAGTPSASASLGTGFPLLDALLPEAGWPAGALTELLADRPGIGALRLLMPALARLQRAGRWLLWIAPPFLPYAPALDRAGLDLSRLLVLRSDAPPRAGQREQLWMLEQALRLPLCGAALAWPGEVPMPALRRLQLAAESSGACGFLYRATTAARQASPAALRLLLEPGPEALRIEVLKCRGGWAGRYCELPLVLA